MKLCNPLKPTHRAGWQVLQQTVLWRGIKQWTGSLLTDKHGPAEVHHVLTHAIIFGDLIPRWVSAVSEDFHGETE